MHQLPVAFDVSRPGSNLSTVKTVPSSSEMEKITVNVYNEGMKLVQ